LAIRLLRRVGAFTQYPPADRFRYFDPRTLAGKLDLHFGTIAADNLYMSYRHLPLICDCGEVPDRILEVGFTAGHELVVHYWCSVCHRAVYFSKALPDCWRDCPEPEAAPQPPAAQAVEAAAADARFLRSIGIRCLEENVDSR